MAKLSNLQRTKNIAFKWPDSDETLNLVVKPDHFTGHNLELMQNAIQDKEDDSVSQHRFLCEFLCTVVSTWDLEDDNGHTVNLDVDTVFELVPITLVAALLEKIQESLRVDPLKPGP